MQFLIDVGLFFMYLCLFLLMCAWAYRFWKMYVNQKFLDKWNEDSIMLEIKLPREINKSPLAAEIALASLLQGGGIGKWYQREFQGALPAYSSLEIASLEGIIHFYIRINKKFKAIVESNFYAQYPGIEIVEAEDYTKKIRYHHLSKDVSLFGTGYKLSKSWVPKNKDTWEPYKDGKGEDYKMPADFFPIKTYVDYGLDKDPKEEFKTDPIAPLLEFMGSIGKGEYFWYQILVQDEGVYDGTKKLPKFYVNKQSHEHLSLKDMADEKKKQIRTAGVIKPGSEVYNEYGEIATRVKKDKDGNETKENITYKFKEPKFISKKEMELTIEEKDEIEAINKKLSKPLALVLPRLIYITRKENFCASGNHIQNVFAFPKPFSGYNGLGNFQGISDPYDFPWQKMKHVEWRGEELFEAYVEREGFFPHISNRKALDDWVDIAFWASSMKSRKIFRMIYEALLYPFDHPHADEVSIMNMEELATLWHLPGQVVATPTLPRIDSNKGMAPTNLPQ